MGFLKKKLKLDNTEKLHLSLTDIIKKYDIKRIKTDFYSYDLLYYIEPGKWFGFTYHNCPQDNFIEIKLGKLFTCKDAMPRFIITNGYNEYLKKLNLKGILNSRIPMLEPAANINEVIKIIQDTFETVIKNIALEVEDNERGRLQEYLIDEVRDINELQQLDRKIIIT